MEKTDLEDCFAHLLWFRLAILSLIPFASATAYNLPSLNPRTMLQPSLPLIVMKKMVAKKTSFQTWQESSAKNRAAALAQLRRICMPKPGSHQLDAPKGVHKKYQQRGKSREELLTLLRECGLNKARSDMFASHFTSTGFVPLKGKVASLASFTIYKSLVRCLRSTHSRRNL